MPHEQQVRTILSELHLLAERSIRKITLDVTANLIESTPVDTGWARANYVPSVGKSFEGTDGTREQALKGSVSQAQQVSGKGEVLAYKLPQGAVFVTNNVPYVPRLNNVLDPGFVQRAVAKAVTQDIKGLAT